jgi:drug/metabolite transporter (DMT)-like permease
MVPGMQRPPARVMPAGERLESMTIFRLRKDFSHRYAVASLVMGAVMISFSGVWVKTSHVPPLVSAFYRVFFGGLILLAATFSHHEIKWHGTRHLFLGLLCGLFFAFDLAFYHLSVHYVGPGLGTILPNFQVLIITTVGVVFLKETVHPLFLASIPIAFSGLFLIVGIDWRNLGPDYQTGVYCGLAAAVCYAAFLLSIRRLQTDHIGTSFFYVLTLVSLVTAVFLGAEVWREGYSFKIPDRQTFLSLAALGLFSQSVGWILITHALPGMRASLSGFILLLQPSLAFVWDVLLFERPTRLSNWIGVALALAAIYIGTVMRRPSR